MMNNKLIALATGILLITAPASNKIFSVDANQQPVQADKMQMSVEQVPSAQLNTDKNMSDKGDTAVQKSDDQILKEIKDEINSDKEFAADAAQIDIKVVNGKVTLSGTTNDQDVKSDVETTAKDIAGDNNVVNNIVLKADK